MTDWTHLDALELRRSHERARLAVATAPADRQLRAVWVAQIEREIAAERAFLGLPESVATDDLDADSLLAELLA